MLTLITTARLNDVELNRSHCRPRLRHRGRHQQLLGAVAVDRRTRGSDGRGWRCAHSSWHTEAAAHRQWKGRCLRIVDSTYLDGLPVAMALSAERRLRLRRLRRNN
ncbi:hypothetical protein MPLB_1460038 [Mesorhizobium sp. ORS 3324]|nr:hypothetical protein MPLB_1460038 [Mesorhizobium sp. ORS 3324]